MYFVLGLFSLLQILALCNARSLYLITSIRRTITLPYCIYKTKQTKEILPFSFFASADAHERERAREREGGWGKEERKLLTTVGEMCSVVVVFALNSRVRESLETDVEFFFGWTHANRLLPGRRQQAGTRQTLAFCGSSCWALQFPSMSAEEILKDCLFHGAM